MVGAIDVANDTVERPEQVAETIRSAMKFVPPEKLYPCTNCGMVPLAREVALGTLKPLASAAALVHRGTGAQNVFPAHDSACRTDPHLRVLRSGGSSFRQLYRACRRDRGGR